MTRQRALVLLLGATVVALAASAAARSLRSPPFRGHLANGADASRLDPASIEVPSVAASPAEPPSSASAEASAPHAGRCPAEPPLELPARAPPGSDAELARLVREHPDALGSASIGAPSHGALWGGIELPESDGLHRDGDNPWGTESAVLSIERAVREVRRCYPGTPPLSIGDLSRRRGGWLRPHASHQAGLDADIGYFYSTGPAWYVTATSQNLDVARTWVLVRAFIEGGNVDAIFMDRSVQQILRGYAEKLSDAQPPLDEVFESRPGTAKQSIIRHAWGHATHFHVRFRDPRAVELGQRLSRVFPHPWLLPYP